MSRSNSFGVGRALSKARSSSLGALTLLSMLVATPATAQDMDWRRALGTPAPDGEGAASPDGLGGFHVCGYTYRNLAAPNAGSMDVWVARYTVDGHPTWIRQFGSGKVDNVFASASDGLQGVFVGGFTSGHLGTTVYGKIDAWLSRLDGAGNLLWTTQFGTSLTERVDGLSPDGSGGVVASIATEGDLGGPNAGAFDACVARFDASGNQLWIRQFGTNDTDHTMDLVAQSGSVYVCGQTWGALVGQSSGSADIWLARYDLAGNQIWIRQFGSDQSDWARSVVPDGSGGIFVSGHTYGAFGGPSAGSEDVWLARYDSSGNQLWIRQFGSNEWDSCMAAVEDGTGGVILCGDTEGDLGGLNAGEEDVWMSRFDSSGTMVWIRQFGSRTRDFAGAACPGFAGGVFLAGSSLAECIPGSTYDLDFDVWLARVNVH